MALRLEQHLLDQAAVLILDVGPLAECTAGGGDALGEVVAQLLELAQREDARSAPGAHAELEALARPGRTEETRELLLQPSQLVEQRPSSGPLVREGARERPRSDSRSHLNGHVSTTSFAVMGGCERRSRS